MNEALGMRWWTYVKKVISRMLDSYHSILLACRIFKQYMGKEIHSQRLILILKRKGDNREEDDALDNVC